MATERHRIQNVHKLATDDVETLTLLAQAAIDEYPDDVTLGTLRLAMDLWSHGMAPRADATELAAIATVLVNRKRWH